MNKIIIIYGPTAIGKSDIAVELAKKINAEIISSDSVQIYKEIDIGSAKITKEEMQGVAHHLIDFKNVFDNYSVYEFVEDCNEKIKEIQKRNKNVIIVGGTGLYIKALTENYNYGNVNKNEELRQQLKNLNTNELVEILHSYNKEVKQDDLNNKQRLIRYIEIAKSGTIQTKNNFDNRFMLFGLYQDREKLYDKINKRVDLMVKYGLLNEARNLLNKVSLDNQCLKAIGYKELLPYFNREKDLESCLNVLKQRTRNYAKRQLTFFNQFKNIIKIEVKTKQQAVVDILTKIEEKNE